MEAKIETERLVLSPLRASDAAALFAYRGDDEVATYQGWTPGSVGEAAAVIALSSQLIRYISSMRSLQ